MDKLFGQVDWNEKVFSITEVDIAYDNFVEVTSEIYNKVAPFCKHYPSTEKEFNCPWISGGVQLGISLAR